MSAVEMPPFGLPPFTYQTILDELSRHPPIERAVVFGSRAMGNYRPGSDVDICLYGAAVTTDVAWRVSVRLNEELPIPYFFDVLSFDHIGNPELQVEITRGA
jgi:uncharacterized protein